MKAIKTTRTREKTYYCVSISNYAYHFDTLEEARDFFDSLCACNANSYIVLKKVTENETSYYSECIAIHY